MMLVGIGIGIPFDQSGSATGPATTPEKEILWDDSDVMSWDDGDFVAWDD